MVKENEASGPPSMQKTQLCLKCGDHTDHDLRATPTGADLICGSCNNLTVSYSKQEMIQVVQQAIERVTQKSSTPHNVTVPEGTRVFVDYNGPGATEKELDPRTIAAHVRLTGELPVAGKPMYTRGPSTHGKAMPLPYGNVSRVEVPVSRKDN